MRTTHPPGHVDLKSLMHIGHIALGAASAIDVGHNRCLSTAGRIAVG